jgi:hypothetical protein
MSLELKDIVSIGGRPGLHKIIGRRQNGLIVETLHEPVKRFPTNLSQKISILEDISIYTLEGDERLGDVFKRIEEEEGNGMTLPAKKASPAELKSFMETVLPNYDADQVYNSDIKKVIQWYGLLKGKVSFEVSENSETTSYEEE